MALAMFCVLGFVGNTEAQLWITEIMADNGVTEKDDAENFSDWIEIYNGGDTEIDLEGHYLTDDPKNLTQWRFPSYRLSPGMFLLIFATDEERGSNVDSMPLFNSRLRESL